MQALLVTHDDIERSVLTLVLQRIGLTSRPVSQAEPALSSWPEHPADLIVLAAELPLGQEQAIVLKFRGVAAVPIVAVVDSLREQLHIALLEAGADLVVQRPYSSRLLMHQISALMRRAGGIPTFSLPSLTIADLSLDPGRRLVRLRGRSARRLTQLEFRMLYTLMVNQGQVMPADLLVEQVWGYSGEGNRDLVRGLINRLRSKVEPIPKEPRYILTIPGAGYTFGPESDLEEQ